MSNKQHVLHVYKKPKQAISGTRTVPVVNDAHLASYLTYNYKHSWTWQGGCDNAQCELLVTPTEAWDVFNYYLGNRVQVIVDNPLEPIWEGYINRIDMELNGMRYSLSLDQMFNRVSVSYFNRVSSPNNKITAEVTNDSSIAIYGSKTGTINIGIEYLATDGRHTETRDKYLVKNAFPQPSFAPASSAQAFNIKLSMKGFYQTLAWDTFEVTDTTSRAVDLILFYSLWYAGFAPSVTGYNSSRTAGNGYGIFYNSEDYFNVSPTNTSYNSSLERRAGQTALDFIKQHVDAGDGVNDFVFGIDITDPNLGYRKAYCRQANTDVEYYTTLYGDRRIYSVSGELIEPWRIRPDALISIRDVPTLALQLDVSIYTPYITSVDYDAESGVVTWASKDDNTLTGAYQLNKVNKTEGSPFGTPDRRVYY